MLYLTNLKLLSSLLLTKKHHAATFSLIKSSHGWS